MRRRAVFPTLLAIRGGARGDDESAAHFQRSLRFGCAAEVRCGVRGVRPRTRDNAKQNRTLQSTNDNVKHKQHEETRTPTQEETRHERGRRRHFEARGAGAQPQQRGEPARSSEATRRSVVS